jgi:hypothetical protein
MSEWRSLLTATNTQEELSYLTGPSAGQKVTGVAEGWSPTFEVLALPSPPPAKQSI